MSKKAIRVHGSRAARKWTILLFNVLPISFINYISFINCSMQLYNITFTVRAATTTIYLYVRRHSHTLCHFYAYGFRGFAFAFWEIRCNCLKLFEVRDNCEVREHTRQVADVGVVDKSPIGVA